MSENTISSFVVLFTAQKTKKFKTWQDGTMKYHSFNKRLTLTDEKGYNIDRKFHKGGVPSVGDEIDFDSHIVTIESLEAIEVANNTHQQTIPVHRAPHVMPARHLPDPPPQERTPSPSASAAVSATVIPSRYNPQPMRVSQYKPPSTIPRKRMIKPDPEEMGEDDHSMEMSESEPSTRSMQPSVQPAAIYVEPSTQQELELTTLIEPEPVQPLLPTPVAQPPSIQQERQASTLNIPPFVPPVQNEAPQPVEQPTATASSSSSPPAKKRVRVGLSKKTSTPLHQVSLPAPGTSSYTPLTNAHRPTATPTPSSSSFTKASNIETINTMNAEATSSNATSASFSFTPPQQGDSSSSHGELSTTKPFKSPFTEGNYTSLVLQFPNSKKALSIIKSKNYPKRSKVVPVKFNNPTLYKETFRKIIHEHLDVLLLNFGMFFYAMYERFGKNKQCADLERVLRSKGIGIYVECELKGDLRYSDKRFRLMIKSGSREHYTKYNKDDLWAISKVSTFESSQTFLARSTYFGPFSDGALEVECMSSRDVRVATKVLQESQHAVYAIRTISASQECMMLDTLDDKLEQLPLLPYLLAQGDSKKSKKKMVAPLPTLDCIQLTRQDTIDVEAKLVEYIELYRLNPDQESVLRQVARSVIKCPGWNDTPENPVVLVHGVYGSGKSFLAAVVIMFIQDIIDTANARREPDDAIQFKILVTSMTNVAVDRILQTLLKLGFDQFIRIGSMKKIAKHLLPYTSKARVSSNEELKELEQMLDDPLNSEEDTDNISTAIQRFRKAESVNQLQTVNVIGTTFMSSAFDVFAGMKFPLVLVDEASQLMEPLTLVPLARFSCHRLILIGDPLQLPPTLATHAQDGKVGKGLDKTLFNRLIELGYESVMLRTQYRCHPRISGISNSLFYERRLINGVTDQDRKPLIEGLPTLLFVDVGGMEQKSLRSNSYWNDTEIAIASHILQTMISFDISSKDLGVISLYKEQADKLSQHLGMNTASDTATAMKSIQISTVDAFQGGEKDVIILSTVRSSESQFMDNQPRVNVALTRAKRHLIILGNRNVFRMNELWSKVLWDCQEHCVNENGLRSLLANIDNKMNS
ncbi:W2 domain-containing protein [Mucor velutinosus]|uniref:W2 domain-containing protein n=1 Tax=Mucor velutinosus TaxID=708070 RepID=A0AAN7DEU3_9FUNG|nr:W2 domain-containing protein [Mucor velutinosus]